MPNRNIHKRSRSPEDYDHDQRPLQREASSGRNSPSQVVPYSEFRARELQDKLKDNNHATVMEAMRVLLEWLKRGDCKKDNAKSFYELIIIMSRNCPKLVREKGKLEKKLNELNSEFHEQNTFVSTWLKDFSLLFQTMQDSPIIWGSLSEVQKQEIENLMQQNLENSLCYSQEIDVENEIKHAEEYHEENSEPAGAAKNKKISRRDLDQLKQENARLHAQYDIELAKQKRLIKQKEERAEAFKKAVHSMENQISSLEQEISELKSFKSQNEARLNEGNQHGNTVSLSQHEAFLMCLAANYLHVHPWGAEVDDICSYLQQADLNIKSNDLENFLRKFSYIFKEESTNGVTEKKNWKYIGFNSAE